MSGVFLPAESTITLRAAISTPSGPSGPHGLNARSIRSANSSPHQPAQQRSFRNNAGRGGVNASSSAKTTSSDQKQEENGYAAGHAGGGAPAVRTAAGVIPRGSAAAKGPSARAGAIKGEGGMRLKGASARGGGAAPSGNVAQKSGSGLGGMRATTTSPVCASPPCTSSGGAECLTLAMPGRPGPRQPTGSVPGCDGPGGFLGSRVEARFNGRVALGGLDKGSGRSVVRVGNIPLQYAAQPPLPASHAQPRCMTSQHQVGLGTGLAPYQMPEHSSGACPLSFQRPELSLAKPQALQQGNLGQEAEAGSYVRYQPGNEGVNGSYFSASGAGGTSSLTTEFGRKRSTRMVSKLNHNRACKPNTGRRSGQAELAAKDLQALPWPNNEARMAEFHGRLEEWMGKLHGLDDITFVMKELGGGNGGQAEKVLACFDWLAGRHENLGPREVKGAAEWGKLASTVISILGRLGNVKAARDVFYRARHNGMGSNVFAYSALISAFGKSGRCAEALEMLQSMKAEGCRPNLITYNAMIDACSKGGLPERAHALFHELQEASLQPDKITYNSLMGAYGRAGQWREAEAVFEEMGRGGLARDLHSYNTLLDAFCKGGQVSLAERLLESMSAAGIEPNVITYSSMIDGYAKSGREMDAVAMYARLQEMMKRNPGIHPDSVCYNTLLDMYGKAGRIKEALAVRSQMEAAGLGTDLVSYNALIDMMGRAGKPREAARLFDQMQSEGYRPNVLTWSCLIGAFAKAGNPTEAMKYFGDFKNAGLQADVVLYSLLIDVHGKHGLVSQAMALLKEMVAQGIPPNVVTYNSLIDAYGRMGQVESAVTTMEEMRGKGITPNAVTYNCVIDAYGKEGRAEEAMVVLQQMKAAGQSPDSFTFSALIDANGKRGDAMAAMRIFREMQEWGVQPNVVTFSAVLNVCRWLSTHHEAAQLLIEAQRSDAQIYGMACGLLLGEGSSAGFWEQAEAVFDFVDSEERERDRCTGMAFYNALTDLLWHFGQREGSYRVLLAARRRNVYRSAAWHTEGEGGVDLHQMSVGAALTMLHTWLLDLHAVAVEGRELPRLLSILTGWGKHSKILGESTVKREVDARLADLGSPFRVSKINEGRIVAHGSAVRDWLRQRSFREVLLLRDVRGRHSQAYQSERLPQLPEFQLAGR